MASVKLGSALNEPSFWRGYEAGERHAGVIDAIFASDEIIGDERPIDVGERVIVNGIDLAKISAHLADFQQQAGGKRRESHVGFLDVDASLAEGEEGIGTGIGVDNGLHADFGLVEFEGAGRRDIVVGEVAGEVADERSVGTKRLGGATGDAVALYVST